MEITLIPGFDNPNLKKELTELLRKCVSFMGCTAFWSVDLKFFNDKDFNDNVFVEALKKPNSFFCADIQLPTNIESLLQYSNEGVKEIYLHKYRQKDEHTQNTNLLHSKIYVFQINDVDVVIWLGSHNLTRYAITGLNLEASVSIKCKKDDLIYLDICKYLINVRDFYCFKFKKEDSDIYRKLQSSKAEKTSENFQTKNVVTLFGSEMEDLINEKNVLLLSLQEKYFAKYKFKDEIYLHTLDEETKNTYLYKCRVVQSGEIGKDKLAIGFVEPIRFARIGDEREIQISRLERETKINQQILESIKYFVKLSFESKINGFEVFEKPTDDDFSYWQTASNSAYFSKLSTNIDVEKYVIQEANFDRKIYKRPVDLRDDWNKINSDLAIFYEELEKTIEGNIQSSNPIFDEKNKDKLNEILKIINKNKGFLKYQKSLMERIIEGLPKEK